MATTAGHGHGHAHAHRHATAAPALGTSPLAHGLGFRLAWAGGLTVLLWLAVYWALQ